MLTFRRISTALLLVGTLVAASGCGAVVARAKIVGAESALGSAKRAGADKKAIYEYTKATLYLEKAREEEAYARFGPAINYGGDAEILADQAKLNAATAEPEHKAEP